ncbi:MAG: hypothetical protein PVG32_13935 [Anaerolineales bacterium]
MTENIDSSKKDSVPFYPDHVTTELKVVIGVTAIVAAIGVLGILLPLGLGDPADPLNTPEHVKPEWYFLALYQLLKFIPKTIGAVAPVLAVLLIAVWPFIDRRPERSTRARRIRLWVVIIGLIILIALTIWGEVS